MSQGSQVMILTNASDITWMDIIFANLCKANNDGQIKCGTLLISTFLANLFGSLDAKNHVFQMKFSHDQRCLDTKKFTQANITAAPPIATCPCCKQKAEDLAHFLRCMPNKNAIQHRLGDLLKDRTSSEPHPLRRIVHGEIRTWMDNPATLEDFSPDLSAYPVEIRESIHDAITSHCQIGWDNAIEGCLVP